ncbi:MAG: hypothetical protein EPN17_07880 [Methylobacter sp.]|nr:MAG: hypothetical protein EPN17_07880 [Methylobacter sp.]
MFALPSLWNLIISTLVFFITVRHLRRYLEEQGLPKGMTRGALVFAMASLVSCGAGAMVDWAQEKIEGPQPVAKHSDDLSQLLKVIGQKQTGTAELKEPDSN